MLRARLQEISKIGVIRAHLRFGGIAMFIFLSRLGRLLIGSIAVVAVTAIFGFSTLTTVPVASHHGSGAGAGGSTLSLVLLNSTDGQAHFGQAVTFNVSTSATSYPSVGLNCYQNGALALSWTAGFFPSYQWTKDVTLSSPKWTSGAASCTATLYYSSGKKTVTLATLPFQVAP